ncbi:PREDICTED: venom allergen 3-like, partial [Wasmannia auropunctata]|uniref:venom allergen 3-like n=1 Tax=Wasmannia auropunctata TaxID=64793 RepID=UPI0005EDA651
MSEISYLLYRLIAVFTIVTADYCNIQSCSEKSSHTMCRYSLTTPATKCEQIYETGLNNVEKKTILDKHNQLRQKVASGQETRGKPGPQPMAVNMSDL